MDGKTDVQRLALRYRIGDMTLPALSSAAAELITSGVASHPLERLAWGDVSGHEEAQWLINAAVEEIGASSDVHEEVRSFVREVASEILRGAVTPYEGARRIWAAAQVVPDEHTYDPFIYAASEYEDRPGDRHFFDKAIVREAHNFAR
jgi:hypothetical protein